MENKIPKNSTPTMWGVLMGRYAPGGTAFAWTILVLCLLLTFALWKYSTTDMDNRARERFNLQANEIVESIRERIAFYELALQGGLALLYSTENVSRSQWKEYVSALNLQHNYPGVQGLGFSLVVPAPMLQQHIENIQKQGFPEYTVRPPGDRQVYTSIIYLEPFDARNQRAFGYDMFSEPVRKAAMEQARDSGRTSISGKVKLVQETSDLVQAGFLMYVPFYSSNNLELTIDERRSKLIGYVYSPFRMNNFMRGVFGKGVPELGLEIFDGTEQAEESLMFRSEELSALNSDQAPRFNLITNLKIMGRSWAFRFYSLPSFEKAIDQRVPNIVLGSGACFSMLIFLVALSLASTQARAVIIARNMTVAHRESEDKIRLIMESTGEPIYGIDTKGECTFCNSACLKVLGYTSQEQVLGKNMHDLIHHSHEDGSYFDVHDCRIFKAFQENIGTHVDDEVLWREDGSSFPAEYWSYPQITGDEVIGAVIVFQDITIRKKNEYEIRSQAALISSLLDSIPDIIFFKDVNGVYLGCNPNFTHFVGRAKSEIIGKTDHDLFSKDVADFFIEQDKLMLKSKKSRHNEELVTYPDGHQVFLDTFKSPYLGENEELIGILGVSRDITERKNHEQELEKFHRALEASSASIVITNKEGVIEYVNPAFTILTGYSKNDIIGNNPRIVKSGIHDEQFYSNLWRTITGGETWRGEICNRRKNGTLFWGSVIITPILDMTGNISHYLALKDDISAKKDLENLKEDVERILRHDLRTPLNSIISLPQIIIDDDNLTKEQRQYVAMIEKSGKRMLRMIDCSLDIFKMEQGIFVANPVQLDIITIVKESLSDVVAKQTGGSINMELTVNGREMDKNDRIVAPVEETIFYAMVSNLLVNAVEASPVDGTVVINFNTAIPRQLTISNKGVVPKEIRDHFFEKYKTHGKKHGTGLGTYSAKLIATAMNFGIDMQTSDFDNQTTITITFPD